MTPDQHAAYIRQLEFKLYKAEHGMGMPYSAEDVAHYRRLLAEAREQMSKPTPGPWTAVPDSGEGEGDWYILAPDEDVIATGLSEPDAALIAAAPTMYDYIAKCAAAGDVEAAQILGGIIRHFTEGTQS